MKKLLAASLALLVSTASVAGDIEISHIRSEYQNIQKALPAMKAESIPLSEYSTEGGEAKAYRDKKGDIRLLKVELFFESGKVFEEFYFENNELIFAFYQRHHYNVPFYVTPEAAKDAGGVAFDPKKTKITEDRNYFAKGKMIRWLDEEKKEVNAASKEFDEREKEIFKFLNEILPMFKRKT